MKLLIVSDSHGRNEHLTKTIQKVGPIDLLIHLGDYGASEEYIKSIAPCDVEMVSGNNDLFNRFPKEKVMMIGKYTVMLTHGHRHGVYYNSNPIKEAARLRQADIVMFGHTHVPMIDMNDDIWAINPGSISLPRQRGHIPSFIIMDIDRNGEAHFTINYCKG